VVDNLIKGLRQSLPFNGGNEIKLQLRGSGALRRRNWTAADAGKALTSSWTAAIIDQKRSNILSVTVFIISASLSER